MEKDFSQWHTLKTAIQKSEQRFHVHEREIWFCSLGLNVGYEQDGRGEKSSRPVIIVKKFNQDLSWCVPLTRTKKLNHPYFLSFSFDDKGQSSAILSQIRLIDKKRMQYKIGTMSLSDFEEMKKRLRQFLE